jgi:hypothetical protein
MDALKALVFAILCGCVGGAPPAAHAGIDGLNGGSVTGKANFTQVGSSVDVTVTLYNCVDGKAYPAHIHTGPACDNPTTQGGHWDMTRGEGIPMVACSGTTGSSKLTRPPTDPSLAWSIGNADPTTNVIGHLVVVHDPDTPMIRIGCGLIQ